MLPNNTPVFNPTLELEIIPIVERMFYHFCNMVFVMYFDKVSISMSLELSTLQPLYDVDPMNSKHMMFNRLKGDDAVPLPLVYHLHRGHLLGPPGDMGVTSFSTSVVLSTVILSPLLPGSTHIFMLSSYHNVTSLMITCATRV